MPHLWTWRNGLTSCWKLGGIEVILSGLKDAHSNETCVQRYLDDTMAALIILYM